MTPKKTLITGSTGFIGTRLCELLSLQYSLPYRAMVRNFSKANRIARMGAELTGGDLQKPASVRKALEGCDAVVHLAHSDDAAGPKEAAILLDACQKAGIQRLIHISSISVHGPKPGPESAREETATIRRYGEAYCDSKAKIEKLVQRYISSNQLPGTILRPGVVYGPYGPFVTGIIHRARGGEISMIDGGAGVCNAVYVDDVCHAIHLALTTDNGLGKAYFIIGNDTLTWKEFTLTFAQMSGYPYVLRNFDSAQARAHLAAQAPTIRSNIRSFIKLLGSPALHKELSTVPLLGAAIFRGKRKLARLLSEEQKLVLKSRIRSRPVARGDGDAPAWPDAGQLVRETCQVRFSNDWAKRSLGWEPRYSFKQGAELTRTWLEFARMIHSNE